MQEPAMAHQTHDPGAMHIHHDEHRTIIHLRILSSRFGFLLLFVHPVNFKIWIRSDSAGHKCRGLGSARVSTAASRHQGEQHAGGQSCREAIQSSCRHPRDGGTGRAARLAGGGVGPALKRERRSSSGTHFCQDPHGLFISPPQV